MASAFSLAPQRLGLSTFRCEICTRAPVVNPTRSDSSIAASSAVPSFRMCVAYTPPALPATRARSMISGVFA